MGSIKLKMILMRGLLSNFLKIDQNHEISYHILASNCIICPEVFPDVHHIYSEQLTYMGILHYGYMAFIYGLME